MSTWTNMKAESSYEHQKVGMFQKIWKSEQMWMVRNILSPIVFVVTTFFVVLLFVLLLTYWLQSHVVAVTGEKTFSASASHHSLLLENKIIPSNNASDPNGIISKGSYYGYYNAYNRVVSKITKIKQDGEVSPKTSSFWQRNDNGTNSLLDDIYRIETLKNGTYTKCLECSRDGIKFTNVTTDTIVANSVNTNTINAQQINTINAHISDTLTVANTINILNSNLKLGGNIVLEDNIKKSEVGLPSLSANPIIIGIGSGVNIDVITYRSKALHLFQLNTNQFAGVAYPLGGSSNVSMSLGAGGLLVNNAISAGGAQVGSSMHIKRNITDYPDDEAIRKLLAFRPRKYQYRQFWTDITRKDPDTVVGGFIAEEVRDNVDSTMAIEVPISNPHLVDNKLLTLRKEDFLPVIVKALQIALGKISYLEKAIAAIQKNSTHTN